MKDRNNVHDVNSLCSVMLRLFSLCRKAENSMSGGWKQHPAFPNVLPVFTVQEHFGYLRAKDSMGSRWKQHPAFPDVLPAR